MVNCSKEKKGKQPTTEVTTVERGVIKNLNRTTHQSDAVFTDQKVNQLYNNYLEIKKHLVNSDPKKVRKASKKLEKFLAQHRYEQSFEATANLIALTRDLQKQRDFFKTLTEETQKVITTSTIISGKIYLQFCPAVFEGEGGYWLSDSKEIRNPYYGFKNLEYGKVKAAIP
ncbi:DUF3347 domain-containing protein [Aquimarina sp. ERC-38]|uniref:DUF3347 domain-containing protein n=1 Tax=Aquimarina sp. ERC-38 TaxID=2949996 RepID=UPI0022479D56|nr:DUF3347 domain-containing protein [Aquimarina sp. ERC-38]UZO81434.1 DUF3347 domain-containing protein [Aquimarina sp. ERC-38]